MKKLFIGALTLSLTTSTFAGDSRSLVNFLDTINRDMNRTTRNQCEGQDEEIVKALNQCAVDLCGKPEDLITGIINEKNFSEYVDAEVLEHKPVVEKLAKEIFEKEKETIQKLSNAFAERINSEGFPNIDKWKDSEMSNMADHLWYGDVDIEIDQSKPLEDRIKLEIKYPKDASQVVKDAIDQYAKAKKHNKLIFPDSVTSDVFTEEEAKTEYFRQINKLLSIVDEARKKDPHFLSWNKDEFEKYRNKKPEDVTLEDIKSDAYSLSWRIESTAQSAKVELPNVKAKSCDDKCALGVKEVVSKQNFKSMSEKLSAKLNELTSETAAAECVAELVDKGMKQSDKESFLKNYPKMKKDFLNRSMANSSEHSRKSFEKYLDEEVNLSFIQNTKEDLTKFLDELKKKSEEKPYDYEYAKQSDQLLIAHIFNQRDYDDKTEMNPTATVCYEGGGAAIWDAFAPKQYISEPKHDEDPTKDNIYVSLFSCTHQSHGKGILSHEIGHALSYAMEKKKLSESSEVAFLETRACITKSVVDSPKTEGGLLDRPEDSMYTEEDMADVLSYHATVDEKHLFLCALFDRDEEGSEYAEVSLPNKHPQDPHSSPLLRALREAIYKKRAISSSCKKIMDHYKDQFRFETCI